jgi:hypothetical protein
MPMSAASPTAANQPTQPGADTVTTVNMGNAPTDSGQSAFRVLAAYAVLIIILALLARTTIGHLVEYYVLVLLIVITLLTQYHSVQAILAPLTTPATTKGAS